MQVEIPVPTLNFHKLFFQNPRFILILLLREGQESIEEGVKLMETFLQVLNNVFHWKTNLHCVNYYVYCITLGIRGYLFSGEEVSKNCKEEKEIKSGQTNQEPHFHGMYDIWIWICYAIGWQQSQLAEMPVHWKSSLEKLKEWSCEENNITL